MSDQKENKATDELRLKNAPRAGLGSLSIVVPVYGSAEILPVLTEKLALVLPSLAQHFEVILVNDGSLDASWEVIRSLQPKYPWLCGINLRKNYGQHNATLCGVRAASGDVIVTMDDDLQHPPEDIHLLLEKLQEGYDVVYGVPAQRSHAWWRKAMSWMIRRILADTMGISRMRDITAFRAFHAYLRDAFKDFRNPNVVLDVLLAWGSSRFATVKVEERPRLKGKSHYNLLALVNYSLIILTGFSTTPLRIASTLGFLSTILGFAIFFYVLGIYFFVGSIPGFPFLASIVSIFSGIQLFSLGIIGEYLARVFDRSIDRPPYVIGETTKSERG